MSPAMNEREIGLTLTTLLREPAFVGAIEAIAESEAAQHLFQMRLHVKAGDLSGAAKAEARADVWQSLLGVLESHARKYKPAGE